jgi:hypothetical protein
VRDLYVLMLSVHGLMRGNDLELGRDADTGGQTLYVVELARALGRHPAVGRVDLLTRLIEDPRVSPDYAAPMNCLERTSTSHGLHCGPPRYLRKEALWNHLDQMVDRTVSLPARTGVFARCHPQPLCRCRLCRLAAIATARHSPGPYRPLAGTLQAPAVAGHGAQAAGAGAPVQLQSAHRGRGAGARARRAGGHEHPAGNREQYAMYENFQPGRAAVDRTRHRYRALQAARQHARRPARRRDDRPVPGATAQAIDPGHQPTGNAQEPGAAADRFRRIATNCASLRTWRLSRVSAMTLRRWTRTRRRC